MPQTNKAPIKKKKHASFAMSHSETKAVTKKRRHKKRSKEIFCSPKATVSTKTTTSSSSLDRSSFDIEETKETMKRQNVRRRRKTSTSVKNNKNKRPAAVNAPKCSNKRVKRTLPRHSYGQIEDQSKAGVETARASSHAATAKNFRKDEEGRGVKKDVITNEKRYKNCEIFMCGGDINRDEKDLMTELRNIFERSTSKYTRIGVESSNAYALIVKGYRENRIVIKIPRKKDGTVDSLRYEYVAGCHIRKTLCKMLPNFMKVYGYVHKHNDEYLILQRVLPGTSLRELVCSPPQASSSSSLSEYKTMFSPVLQSLVLQVLCSLQVAQNEIGFVHYDLHFGNVLVKRDTNVGQSILYRYVDRRGKNHNMKIPVLRGQIAVIIDYGRTRTDESSKFLYENDQFFKPYKFLLKPKYNRIDIRQFNGVYDAKRFCSILQKYVPDFDYDITEIREPHDAIKHVLTSYKR